MLLITSVCNNDLFRISEVISSGEGRLKDCAYIHRLTPHTQSVHEASTRLLRTRRGDPLRTPYDWNDNVHRVTGRTGDDVLAEDALTEDGFVTVRVRKVMHFYSKREFRPRLPNLDKIKSHRFPRDLLSPQPLRLLQASQADTHPTPSCLWLIFSVCFSISTSTSSTSSGHTTGRIGHTASIVPHPLLHFSISACVTSEFRCDIALFTVTETRRTSSLALSHFSLVFSTSSSESHPFHLRYPRRSGEAAHRYYTRYCASLARREGQLERAKPTMIKVSLSPTPFSTFPTDMTRWIASTPSPLHLLRPPINKCITTARK